MLQAWAAIAACSAPFPGPVRIIEALVSWSTKVKSACEKPAFVKRLKMRQLRHTRPFSSSPAASKETEGRGSHRRT